jgi:class 3 adenylate cyclase
MKGLARSKTVAPATLARLKLSFADKALERRFIEYYVMSSLRVSQTLMLIGAAAYYISFISDHVMDPTTGASNHILRGAVSVPVMVICSLMLFLRNPHKYYEIISLVYYIIPQIILCVIFLNIKDGFEYAVLAFILLLMGVNLTFTVRFKYTLIISIFGYASILFAELYANNVAYGWIKINFMYMTTAIIFSSVSAHLRERAARARFLTDQAIVESQQRIDDLLHSMLPPFIAKRMQAGETSIADSVGEATIIFANVSGINDPARDVKPINRVRGLNRLFSLFDIEAERFGIEKIKTIGGSYMAIAGLSDDAVGGDHTENTADFALAILAIVQKWNADLGINIDFRVGIHVGPIVAGVIGVQRPKFDCWGDSVNMASRLERCAQPGEICVSDSCYWRLKQKFIVTPTGELDLKGIGLSHIYRLVDRSQTAPDHGVGMPRATS